jgi:predicted Zn-dependent peptidase
MNRTIAPPITHTAKLELKLKEAENYTLDNGIEVCMIDAGKQDVLSIDFNFNAGNIYETKNLVSGTTSHLLKCGTTTKTAFELNEAFEYYGAYLNRGAGAEFANISLHTLSKHVEVLLPMVYDVIYNSILPQKELEIFQQNSLQRLKMNLQKGDFIANRLIDAYLYGNQHPYGRYSSEEDYLAVTQTDCDHFYTTHYKQSKFKIFVGGKLPSNLKELLNKCFGQHKIENEALTIPEKKYDPAEQKKYEVINDATAVQGAIRIARPFFNRHHPDFKDCMVLNNIFGGYFGSRLMSNIREDKGYTYGIHSYVQNHIEETAWMISTEAGKDVTPATLVEVYKEMDLLKNELVDAEELQLVQNYMIGQLLNDLDGPFQLINRWKIYDLNNLTGQYFYDYVNAIKNITPSRIQELANKYFNREDFYELVVY